jgi:hypothetical protein
MMDYAARAATDMRGIAYDVKAKVEQTVALKRSTRDWLTDIQRNNLAAMDKADKDYTGLIDAARFVRDTSADIVVVGSTIATGGAAAYGLLATGSVLKGTYKYQDTGNAGAAVLYGAGSMLLGAFKVKPSALTASGEYALIIAQGVLETGTSFASGKSFGEAVSKGGLKIVGGGAAQALFGATVVKSVFSKMPVPFTVLSQESGGTMKDVANELLTKTSKKMVEKGVRTGVPAAAGALTGRSTAPLRNPSSAPGSGFIDGVPIEQMGLLYFAIVNMENGIGRGW